ncbi:MAG: type IV pilus secretin PilQ [Acidobacteriota bacterium]
MRSKRLHLIFSALLMLMLLPPDQGLSASPETAGLASLQDVSFRSAPGQTVVLLRGDRKFDYTSYYPNPRLFILDVPAAQSKLSRNFIDFKTSLVDFATVSQIGEGTRNLIRIEFNLQQPVQYALQTNGNVLRLTFRGVFQSAPGAELVAPDPDSADRTQKATEAEPVLRTPPKDRVTESLSEDPSRGTGGSAHSTAQAGRGEVHEVGVSEEDDVLLIQLQTSAKPHFKHFELRGPQRLVIDLNGTTYRVSKQLVTLQSDLIRRIRFGYGDVEPGRLVRCVFDLSRKASYRVEATDSGLTVRFEKDRDRQTALQGGTGKSAAKVSPWKKAVALEPTLASDISLSAKPNWVITFPDAGQGAAPQPLAVPLALPSVEERSQPQLALLDKQLDEWNQTPPSVATLEPALESEVGQPRPESSQADLSAGQSAALPDLETSPGVALKRPASEDIADPVHTETPITGAGLSIPQTIEEPLADAVEPIQTAQLLPVSPPPLTALSVRSAPVARPVQVPAPEPIKEVPDAQIVQLLPEAPVSAVPQPAAVSFRPPLPKPVVVATPASLKTDLTGAQPRIVQVAAAARLQAPLPPPPAAEIAKPPQAVASAAVAAPVKASTLTAPQPQPVQTAAVAPVQAPAPPPPAAEIGKAPQTVAPAPVPAPVKANTLTAPQSKPVQTAAAAPVQAPAPPPPVSAAPKSATQSATPAPLRSAGAPVKPAIVLGQTVAAQQTGGQVISQVTPQQAPTYSGELISLELKDADIKDFFRLIGEISGLNIVLDPDVSGALTIFLNDVPWDQALDVVLRNNSLGKQLDGNVLRIASNKTLEAEEAQRKRLADARVLSAELQTETRVLSYAKAADLSTVLKKVLSPRGDIIVDVRTNSMIISDIPGKFPAIDALIAQLDKKIKQVEIEARVVAANREFLRDIGVQIGLVAGNNSQNKLSGAVPGNPFARVPPPSVTINQGQSGGANDSIPLISNLGANAPTSGLSLFGGFTNNFIIDTLITAAERRGNAKLISKPKIITQDNIEGFVQQGLKIPVQTTVNNTVSVQFFDFALKLKVTPQITEEGTIILITDIENSTPDFSRQVQGIPTINTQQTKTTVLVNNGGTVVVGGVLIDNEQINIRQVPGFGSIPLIGNLFRNRSVNKQTQELIFFLSPKIL